MRFIRYRCDGKMLIAPESLRNQTFDQSICSPISKLPHYETPSRNHKFRYSHELALFLQGKELLIDELPFSLIDIHKHYEHGYVTYVKGIVRKKNEYVCTRCGNCNQSLFASFDCARCNEECVYCRKCIELGRVSECTPLVRWIGPELAREKLIHQLAWQKELSTFQKQASARIIRAIERKERLLVWAVTGSGKTEMLFEGIHYALLEQQKVLIATPRTDVVLELAPRLKQAFPTTEIVALYGGSRDRTKVGELYIATTHQLLRFYRAFDVVIIDEVDAFPYSYDASLAYAVEKARKQTSSIIYLTATPSRAMQKEIESNTLPCVKVARRYHGYPLPEPVFKWCGNWRRQLQKGKLPKSLLYWLHQHKENPVFLFVPTISILEQVTTLLRKQFPKCEGVHAEDANRHEKIKAFREQKIPIFVTTTILERGVTIPNVQVGVFGSDHDIFTESALVQMAGRVGRNVKYPSGDVVFFHFGITQEMKRAKRHIIAMNEVKK